MPWDSKRWNTCYSTFVIYLQAPNGIVWCVWFWCCWFHDGWPPSPQPLGSCSWPSIATWSGHAQSIYRTSLQNTYWSHPFLSLIDKTLSPNFFPSTSLVRLHRSPFICRNARSPREAPCTLPALWWEFPFITRVRGGALDLSANCNLLVEHSSQTLVKWISTWMVRWSPNMMRHIKRCAVLYKWKSVASKLQARMRLLGISSMTVSACLLGCPDLISETSRASPQLWKKLVRCIC